MQAQNKKQCLLWRACSEQQVTRSIVRMRRWNTKQVSVLPKVTRVHQNQNLHTEIKETLLENIQIVSVPISALLLTICSFWVHPPTPPFFHECPTDVRRGKEHLRIALKRAVLRLLILLWKLLPGWDGKNAQCRYLGTQQEWQIHLGAAGGLLFQWLPGVCRAGFVILCHLPTEAEPCVQLRTQTSEAAV